MSLWRAAGEAETPRPCIWGHRTVICIFHKSIATRYCLRTVQPASRQELLLAGLTRTPTEQNDDDGWSEYSYVLSDGVLWQWTGGLQYTILYSLASEHNPKWYGRRTGLPRATQAPSPAAPRPRCWCWRFTTRLFTDTPSLRLMECVVVCLASSLRHSE